MESIRHSTSNFACIGNGLHIDDLVATWTVYEDGTHGMVTYWKPSPEDLESLNSNGLIRLDILTESQRIPPVAINVSNIK